MSPAVWIFLGVMVALAVVPLAITVSDVLECRNRQINTHSSLRTQGMSKGIQIVRSGPGDPHKGWALSAPVLRTVSEDNGRTHYVFGMRLVA